MSRRGRWVAVALVVVALVIAASVGAGVAWRARAQRSEAPADSASLLRRALWFEVQPVSVEGCVLERFGERGDGGYLLCGNLLDGVAAGYSYGISGYDGWGCDVATKRRVPVHQYDCFNLTRPACQATTVFHEECVGAAPATTEGRRFDTLEHQLIANGDGASRVVMKMDVEGAEWEAFLTAPYDVLARIDQLVVEFHGTDERRFLNAVRRLKQYFHVANLHMNNHSCDPTKAPFPAWAYEVLFVSKRLASARGGPALPPGAQPLDAANSSAVADCQTLPPP